MGKEGTRSHFNVWVRVGRKSTPHSECLCRDYRVATGREPPIRRAADTLKNGGTAKSSRRMRSRVSGVRTACCAGCARCDGVPAIGRGDDASGAGSLACGEIALPSGVVPALASAIDLQRRARQDSDVQLQRHANRQATGGAGLRLYFATVPAHRPASSERCGAGSSLAAPVTARRQAAGQRFTGGLVQDRIGSPRSG